MVARITLALLAAAVAQTAHAKDANPAAPAPAPRVATPSPATPAPAPNAAPAPAATLSESKFLSALYSAIAKRTPQTSPAGEGEATASFHCARPVRSKAITTPRRTRTPASPGARRASRSSSRNPKAKIPGTKMIFQGLAADKDQEDVWAYLVQFGPDGK